MTQKLPTARNEAVAVQELENETLIYDFEIDKAYCLNETSSTIYRHCDGQTSFEDLKQRYQYTDDLIYLALDELQKNNLIESEKIRHFAGMNRREVIRRVGLSTLVVLPVISALVAPSAANAASNCAAESQSCTFNDFQQSNCCEGLRCNFVDGPVVACQTCRDPGEVYAGIGDDASVATCNASTQKNLCCSTIGDAGVDGTNCTCPVPA